MVNALPCSKCRQPIKYPAERLLQACQMWPDYTQWLHFCQFCVDGARPEPVKELT